MVDLRTVNRKNAGKLFDYAVLPKNVQEKDIREGCRQAVKYNCAAFYSSSCYWTPVILEELAGTDILIGAGIDFPFGVSPAKLKALETEYAVNAGCTTVDVVMNVGALKDKRYHVIEQELKDFVAAAGGAVTKVILEMCFLSNEEIAAASKMIADAGAHFAKTASGQFEGPDMGQFLVMKDALKDTDVKLKVSGVKFPRPQNAYAFLMAGADIIGTRAAPEIIDNLDIMREIGLIPPYIG